jgi:hypothetical protein
MTDWTRCSDPPEESCSDAGCPVHGWHDDERLNWLPYDGPVAGDDDPYVNDEIGGMT